MKRIALVCDWLTGMRGGERCLEVVCETYENAEIFTLVYIEGEFSEAIESKKIHTSYIQNLPGSPLNFRKYLPLFPNAIGKFDLSGFDVVLSFSHCVAKGVKVPENIPHICYCHTPMRYAWYMRDEYLSGMGFIKKKLAGAMLDRLQKWDIKSSAGVSRFVTNSVNVQKRIKQAYGRDAEVIYPPVDCNRFGISDADDGFYLIVSALVPYKRVDIAVGAFNDINKELVIVGKGPELEKLKNIASENIKFIEEASDEEITEYMSRCRGLIFPGEEDFGIVPLEAQACGKGVIAFGEGGALETVIGLDKTEENNATGVFFYEQSGDALKEAVILFEQNRERIKKSSCRQNTLRFDRSIYKGSMRELIDRTLG